MEQLQGRHIQELADNNDTYSKEFETFKAKVSQAVKELKDEIAQLKDQLKDRDKTIYEMKHGSFFAKLKHLFTH